MKHEVCVSLTISVSTWLELVENGVTSIAVAIVVPRTRVDVSERGGFLLSEHDGRHILDEKSARISGLSRTWYAQWMQENESDQE